MAASLGLTVGHGNLAGRAPSASLDKSLCCKHSPLLKRQGLVVTQAQQGKKCSKKSNVPSFKAAIPRIRWREETWKQREDPCSFLAPNCRSGAFGLSRGSLKTPQRQLGAGEGQTREKTFSCRSAQRPPNEIGKTDAAVIFRPAREQDMAQIQWLVLKEAMNPLNLIRERFLVAEDTAGQLVACGQVASIPGDPPIQELRSLVVVTKHRGQGIGTRLLQELLARVTGEVYLLTIGRAMRFYQRAGFEEVSEVPPQLSLELKLGNVVARIAAQDRCLVMKARR